MSRPRAHSPVWPILLTLLLAGITSAQPTYTATDLGPVPFASISGTGTLLGTVSGCDDFTENVVLPFPFDYYGRAITSIAVSSNGQLNMDARTSSHCCSAVPIPAADGNDDAIFFAKTDLCPGCGGNVYSQLQGSPGSQTLTIEFTDSGFCCSATPTVSVQVVLYEADSAIEMYWGPGTLARGISAGVEDIGGIDGTPAVSGAGNFDPTGQMLSWPTDTGCRFDRGDALTANSISFTPSDPAPGGTADVTVEVENNEASPLSNVRVDLFLDPATPPGSLDQSPDNTQINLPAGPGATALAAFPGLTSPIPDIWRLYANVNSDGAIPGDQRTNNLLGPVLMGWSQSFTGTCGDCNSDGMLSILDALRGAQLAAGLIGPPTPDDFLRCDANDTASITVTDALLMAQAAAGLGVTLTCPPPPGGPVVKVRNPVAPATAGIGDLTVEMDLWEPAGNPIDLLFEFSTDAGVTFAPCTAGGSSPIANPAIGVPTPAMDELFLWDTQADVPLAARPTTGLLRVTASLGPASHVDIVDPLDFILLPDFGEQVLLVTGTADSTDLTLPRWQGTGYVITQMDPATIDATYADGAALQAQFWCIWAGCQGTITNAPFPTMMGPGGKIEDFINRGGIFVAHGAHNAGIDVDGPGGSRFVRSAPTDNNPTVADVDHEFITGAGFGGVTLTAVDFAGWSTTSHGNVSAPPAPFVDAMGVNLGTSPSQDMYNLILASPAGGGAPCLLELTPGQGYALIDIMTFDWGTRGTTPQDSLLQSINYIVFIRPGFNQ